MQWNSFIASRVRRSLLVLGVLLAGSAAAEEVVLPLPKGPAVEPMTNCHPIDFETAEISGSGQSAKLHVKGKVAAGGLTIALIPVMYVMMPEYWHIVLVGCSGDKVSEGGAEAAFSVEFQLAGTIGRKGILLVGSSPGNEQQIDIYP